MPSGPNVHNSMDALLKDTLTRLSIVERRVALNANAGPNIGTAAQRDARFGVPVTTEEKVALANRRIEWFNTELGWSETYYVVHGTTGLQVRGLVSGTAEGWYPSGPGPWANLDGFAQARTNNQPSSNYYGWGNNNSQRKGFWITRNLAPNPERFIMTRAGFYRIYCNVGFPSGSGTGVASLRAYTAAGTQVAIDQRPITLLASFGQRHVFDLGIQNYSANSYALFMTDSASWTITVESFVIEYLGAPLYEIPEA